MAKNLRKPLTTYIKGYFLLVFIILLKSLLQILQITLNIKTIDK